MACCRFIRTGASCLTLLAAFTSPSGAAHAAQAGELQTTGLSWRAQVRLGSAHSAQIPLQALGTGTSYALPSGMLLGDYYFSFSRWGWSQGLRASGGLYMAGSAPLAELGFAPPATGSSAIGSQNGLRTWRLGGDARESRPYLGLGYSRQGLWGQWGLTADFGLLAEPGATSLSTRRTLDDAVREIRFSPLLQLGVRYAF